ncbi:unnamed protein product, partial [marine sediment metagenome]
TPLKAAHAAAQKSLFDTSQAVKEAEAILKKEANLLRGKPKSDLILLKGESCH